LLNFKIKINSFEPQKVPHMLDRVLVGVKKYPRQKNAFVAIGTKKNLDHLIIGVGCLGRLYPQLVVVAKVLLYEKGIR
jgi:hypothetical protein